MAVKFTEPIPAIARGEGIVLITGRSVDGTLEINGNYNSGILFEHEIHAIGWDISADDLVMVGEAMRLTPSQIDRLPEMLREMRLNVTTPRYVVGRVIEQGAVRLTVVGVQDDRYLVDLTPEKGHTRKNFALLSDDQLDEFAERGVIVVIPERPEVGHLVAGGIVTEARRINGQYVLQIDLEEKRVRIAVEDWAAAYRGIAQPADWLALVQRREARLAEMMMSLGSIIEKAGV